MRLRVLFVDAEPGENWMPNAVAICDEYAEEAGALEFWDDEVEKVKAGYGSNAEFRQAFVFVPDDLVRKLFEPPAVPMSHIKAAAS